MKPNFNIKCILLVVHVRILQDLPKFTTDLIDNFNAHRKDQYRLTVN